MHEPLSWTLRIRSLIQIRTEMKEIELYNDHFQEVWKIIPEQTIHTKHLLLVE